MSTISSAKGRLDIITSEISEITDHDGCDWVYEVLQAFENFSPTSSPSPRLFESDVKEMTLQRKVPPAEVIRGTFVLKKQEGLAKQGLNIVFSRRQTD